MNTVNIKKLSITLDNGETINFEMEKNKISNCLTITCSNSDSIPHNIMEKAQAAATLLLSNPN